MKIDDHRERDPVEHWYAAYNRGGPWTEAEFWRIPEDVKWVELHDGCLLLQATNTLTHQHIQSRLLGMVAAAVGENRSCHRLDVRMAEGRRYRVPDLLVTRDPIDERPIDAAQITLIGEIVDEWGGDERGQRMTAYQEAGIPWYLVVEKACGPLTAQLYELRAGEYLLAAQAGADEVLKVREPFVCDIAMAELSPWSVSGDQVAAVT